MNDKPTRDLEHQDATIRLCAEAIRKRAEYLKKTNYEDGTVALVRNVALWLESEQGRGCVLDMSIKEQAATPMPSPEPDHYPGCGDPSRYASDGCPGIEAEPRIEYVAHDLGNGQTAWEPRRVVGPSSGSLGPGSAQTPDTSPPDVDHESYVRGWHDAQDRPTVASLVRQAMGILRASPGGFTRTFVKLEDGRHAELSLEPRPSAPSPGCPACAGRCEYLGTFSDGSSRCGRMLGHSGPHYSDTIKYPVAADNKGCARAVDPDEAEERSWQRMGARRPSGAVHSERIESENYTVARPSDAWNCVECGALTKRVAIVRGYTIPCCDSLVCFEGLSRESAPIAPFTTEGLAAAAANAAADDELPPHGAARKASSARYDQARLEEWVAVLDRICRWLDSNGHKSVAADVYEEFRPTPDRMRALLSVSVTEEKKR